MELDQIVDSVPDFLLERTKEHFNLGSIDDAKAKWRHALSKAGLVFARDEPMNGYVAASYKASGVLEELTGCWFDESFEDSNGTFCDFGPSMNMLLAKALALYPNIREKTMFDLNSSFHSGYIEMCKETEKFFDQLFGDKHD